ncbi:hypothetical protein [Sphingobacterium hungaricum]|uniref:Uncharacterized protein n=1 Tax=Sphingobacterium hungaricum TaxID=2082723 RepID=A0A928UVZ9_9SPHI|nr:hypothetical protein [Sphingobacterium hungaricum]MBE8712536.1 hypothetical protein [Sphingobacterium hungaricum]
MSKEIQKEIVQTITDQNKFIRKVKITYATWWQKLFSFLFILPKYKRLYLSDLWPATVFKLLAILTDLKVHKSKQDIDIYSMIQHNIPLFIEFLATGINNKSGKNPQWLIDAINYQFSNEELLTYIIEVYRRLDVETFFGITGSLIDLQHLNHILEAPAHGQSSATSVNITDGANKM